MAPLLDRSPLRYPDEAIKLGTTTITTRMAGVISARRFAARLRLSHARHASGSICAGSSPVRSRGPELFGLADVDVTQRLRLSLLPARQEGR
jgi:hypothetical protein